MSILENLRNRPRALVSAGLITAGLAAGAVLGTTVTAGASTTTSSTGSSASAPAATPPNGHCAPLSKSGTVTAVGTNSVTIDGTTYAVTSSSDIDKNGEAALSDLKVGDKVSFSTVSSASSPTIDRLHAGSEALDRPSGPPPGGGPGGGYGGAPQGQSSTAA